MLSRDTTGLIVVDIQGKLARLVHQSDTMIESCIKLVSGFKQLQMPIILLEQNPDKLGRTVDELQAQLQGVRAITKFSFNACDEPSFIDRLDSYSVETWLICGIEAHICVYQTVMGLLKHDIQVQVVRDCISSRSSSNVELAIGRLKDEGIAFTGVEMCLYELVKDCRADDFKAILNLVR